MLKVSLNFAGVGVVVVGVVVVDEGLSREQFLVLCYSHSSKIRAGEKSPGRYFKALPPEEYFKESAHV